MIIAITIFISVALIISAASWIAWQVTPGPHSNKALAAGLTAAALMLLAIVFFSQILLLIIISAVLITAIGVATGRLTFWQGLAAGIGAPVILYMGIILIRIMHGVAFGGTSIMMPSSFQIESLAAVQIFGIDLPLLIAGLGTALLAAASVANADARPWLAFIGVVILIGGGAAEVHHHWDLISLQLDSSDPRTCMWFVIATVTVIVVVATLLNHGRRGGGP